MPLAFRVPVASRVRPIMLTIALLAVMVGGSGAPGGVRPVAAAPARPAAPVLPAAAMPPALSRSPASSRSPSSPGSPVGVRFRWPLDGRPPVVRRFEPPPQPWLPGHRGVDLSAEAGAPVYAAGPGVVRFAGMLAGRGVVSVDHPNGLRTTYEPVTPVVVAGQQVRAGDVIGKLDAGHPGCPAVSCLHWGLRLGATYLDPLTLVGAARVRLLPLAPNTP